MVEGVQNLNEFVKNNLHFNEGLTIQDVCKSFPILSATELFL